MLAARLAAPCHRLTPILSSNDSQLVAVEYEVLDAFKDALDRHVRIGQCQSATLLEPW